jgi:pimeloyl-ACP methyl ester carboxylesterase
MRMLARLLFGAVTLLALGLSGSAGPSDYPILFVHEYCSDAGSWDPMFQNLARRRYGDDLVRLYQEANGAVAVRGGEARPQATSFAIDFINTSNRTFDATAVADVSIRRKAEELKRVIDYIKTTTGHARVIVVSHGMGGLVGRAYIQGLATTTTGTAIPYTSDIAGLITIGTPHLGSDFAALPADWDASCAAADTVNRREMLPSAGGLLDNLNRLGWPAGTRLDAIATYYPDQSSGDTDGLVTRHSQDVGAISNYWARQSEAHVWSQPLAGRRVPGFESMAPHSAVLRTASTAALVDSIVRELDVAPAAAIRPFETQGLPESAHPYANNFDSSWSYTLAGNPSALDVRFDPRTFVEWDYDFIHVMNGAGTPVTGSPFTGNDLGGRTIRVQGATVRIRLTSDPTDNAFGYRLVSINAATGANPPQELPESSHPYADSYYGTWPYFVSGSPSEIDVTFSADTFVEEDYDYIYITDVNYKQVEGSPFTGRSLAGRTIRVPGSSVWIELETDDSVNGYGFKVTSAVAAGSAPTGPVTTAADGPLMANTVAAMIKGALEGPASASLLRPPTALEQLVSFVSPIVYAQGAFTKNCPGGGSVRIERVSTSGGRHTLSNSSATFTSCGFDAQRRNAMMNGVLTLNGAWCPGQSSCSGPGVSNPSTPIRTTGSLDVSDVGSVPFIGDVGSTSYSMNLGCSGCIFQGAPDTPPTPSPNTCTATVSPTSVSAAAGGGSYGVTVRVGSTCPWTASSNSGFISVTSGSSGRGDGSVSFSVSANTGAARNGSLSVAGRTVTVSQSAGTTAFSVTGNWTVTDTSATGSGTMTLSQSGTSVTGTAMMPSMAGGQITTNRVTGTVNGSTVTLRHDMAFRVSQGGVTVSCSGTTNYQLQSTSSTRMTGPSSGSASCAVPGVSVPPQSVSGTATFTKQ